MSNAPRSDWPAAATIALATLPSLTAEARQNLLQAFSEDAAAIFQADEASLLRVRGVGPAIAAAIAGAHLADFTERMAGWRAAGVRLLLADEDEYPAMLRQRATAPPLLFARGRWSLPGGPVVGIVGTRSPSREGRELAAHISEQLVESGAHLVSGLAQGIDAAAHWAALRVPGSDQWAVLGSGVLQLYPQENRALAEALILDGGAVLSPFAPDAPPARSQFVWRNRILAALCGALIVVETSAAGGAMHTARFAGEMGCPVYVADLLATGNQELRRRGARALPIDLTEVLIAAAAAQEKRANAPRLARAATAQLPI